MKKTPFAFNGSGFFYTRELSYELNYGQSFLDLKIGFNLVAQVKQ